jgi:hypothetical protein
MAGIGVALALLTGVGGLCVALIEPIGQRMTFTEGTVEKHLTLAAHHGAVDDLARIKEKFAEIETQFRGLREVLETRIAHLEHGIEDLKTWRLGHARWDAAWVVRLEVLERGIHGTPLLVTGGVESTSAP